jgi:hypothetical protein
MSCSLHGFFETFENVQEFPTNHYFLSYLITVISLNKDIAETQDTSRDWPRQLISVTCNLDFMYMALL